MRSNATKYSIGRGIAAFALCGLLGFVWGGASVPIIAGLVSIVVAPLVFLVSASWWMINLPIALNLGASLYCFRKIVARPNANATPESARQSATDAIYGAIGFGLFYLLAWLALILFVTTAAPL